jgi:hypothetical protein
MARATIDAQELLPSNWLHKSSKIKSGDSLTVKTTVNLNFTSANPGINPRPGPEHQ